MKPNDERAKLAVVLIWIVLGLELITLISDYFQYNLLQQVLNGENFSIEAATANDTRQQFIAILYLIAYVISGITFIQWFRRAYNNLHQKVSYLSHTEGWAAGSWFVPIVNLYRPYQIMKELYQETKEYLIKNGNEVGEVVPTGPMGLWWGLWIINGILGQFIFRFSLKAETIEELSTVTIVSMVSSLIGIPLALITIKIIKGYAAMEPALLRSAPINEKHLPVD
jgi:hypothetical protein